MEERSTTEHLKDQIIIAFIKMILSLSFMLSTHFQQS